MQSGLTKILFVYLFFSTVVSSEIEANLISRAPKVMSMTEEFLSEVLKAAKNINSSSTNSGSSFNLLKKILVLPIFVGVSWKMLKVFKIDKFLQKYLNMLLQKEFKKYKNKLLKVIANGLFQSDTDLVVTNESPEVANQEFIVEKNNEAARSTVIARTEVPGPKKNSFPDKESVSGRLLSAAEKVPASESAADNGTGVGTMTARSLVEKNGPSSENFKDEFLANPRSIIKVASSKEANGAVVQDTEVVNSTGDSDENDGDDPSDTVGVSVVNTSSDSSDMPDESPIPVLPVKIVTASVSSSANVVSAVSGFNDLSESISLSPNNMETAGVKIDKMATGAAASEVRISHVRSSFFNQCMEARENVETNLTGGDSDDGSGSISENGSIRRKFAQKNSDSSWSNEFKEGLSSQTNWQDRFSEVLPILVRGGGKELGCVVDCHDDAMEQVWDCSDDSREGTDDRLLTRSPGSIFAARDDLLFGGDLNEQDGYDDSEKKLRPKKEQYLPLTSPDRIFYRLLALRKEMPFEKACKSVTVKAMI